LGRWGNSDKRRRTWGPARINWVLCYGRTTGKRRVIRIPGCILPADGCHRERAIHPHSGLSFNSAIPPVFTIWHCRTRGQRCDGGVVHSWDGGQTAGICQGTNGTAMDIHSTETLQPVRISASSSYVMARLEGDTVTGTRGAYRQWSSQRMRTCAFRIAPFLPDSLNDSVPAVGAQGDRDPRGHILPFTRIRGHRARTPTCRTWPLGQQRLRAAVTDLRPHGLRVPPHISEEPPLPDILSGGRGTSPQDARIDAGVPFASSDPGARYQWIPPIAAAFRSRTHANVIDDRFYGVSTGVDLSRAEGSGCSKMVHLHCRGCLCAESNAPCSAPVFAFKVLILTRILGFP
jgi:hypothetical protein